MSSLHPGYFVPTKRAKRTEQSLETKLKMVYKKNLIKDQKLRILESIIKY